MNIIRHRCRVNFTQLWDSLWLATFQQLSQYRWSCTEPRPPQCPRPRKHLRNLFRCCNRWAASDLLNIGDGKLKVISTDFRGSRLVNGLASNHMSNNFIFPLQRPREGEAKPSELIPYNTPTQTKSTRLPCYDLCERFTLRHQDHQVCSGKTSSTIVRGKSPPLLRKPQKWSRRPVTSPSHYWTWLIGKIMERWRCWAYAASGR